MTGMTGTTGTTGRWTPYFVSSDPRETSEIVGQRIISHSLAHESRRTRPATVRFRTASLDTLTFHEMAYSMFGEGEARINVPNMANIYLCEINLGGRMAVGQMQADRSFGPGEIYMINANGPHAKVWQTDGRRMMIKIHQTDMEAALVRRIGMPVRDPLVFEPAPCVLSGGAATLGKMIDLLAQDFEYEGSFFDGPGGGDAKQILLDMMLNVLPHNYTHLMSDTSPTLRPRHVRHAAAYVHSHSREAIGLDDMVRASGVSRRSLHAGFRKYYGVTPMAYLRNVRNTHPRAHGQAPHNRLCHVVSNVIIESENANGDIIVRSRFHCAEYFRYEVRNFTGKYRHALKKTDDGYRIALQRVDLVNREGPYDYVLQWWL